MRIDILTLFPEMCERFTGESIIGRAQAKGALEIKCHNIRDYTVDRQKRVDDAVFGGGMGMLMQVQPIIDCFDAVCQQTGKRPHLIYMSPQGKVLTQQRVKELAQLDSFAILCGHYEGVDERVIESIVDEEISIGDFVLTGGEMPALILADAVSRLCDGVLSGEECYTDESHYNGLLEYPQYSRPADFRGMKVPDVLLSGHHANIDKWRREQSLKRTYEKRPDMLEKAELTPSDLKFIESLKREKEDKKTVASE